MNHLLHIFCNGEHIGVLEIDTADNDAALVYDAHWQQTGFALSPHLPLHGQSDTGSIKKFLANLLPEGEGLEFVSRFFQISKANRFGLIEAVGAESAGALTFTNKEQIPTSFREISKEELAQRIKDRKTKNITLWDDKPRLSVAGVQEKLPLVAVDGIYGIGEGQIASTHILKFEKNAGEHLVLNEHFCMRLASLCGVKTAKTAIEVFGKEKVLVVERFDRVVVPKEDAFVVEKKHIIDGCQLLDLDVTMKYEKPYGGANEVIMGASFGKLFEALKFCKTKALAKLEVLRWAFFNLLSNNYDAHAKNISFFVSKNGIEVAPFYDLLNIAMYPQMHAEFAFAYGDEFVPEHIKGFSMVAFCQSIGIHPRLFKQELHAMIKTMHKQLATVLEELCVKANEEECLFLEKLSQNIEQNLVKFQPIAEDFTQLYEEYKEML
ncbi:MAG: HipA domain-containing protein [Sulfuricurvum sp.]